MWRCWTRSEASRRRWMWWRPMGRTAREGGRRERGRRACRLKEWKSATAAEAYSLSRIGCPCPSVCCSCDAGITATSARSPAAARRCETCPGQASVVRQERRHAVDREGRPASSRAFGATGRAHGARGRGPCRPAARPRARSAAAAAARGADTHVRGGGRGGCEAQAARRAAGPRGLGCGR